MNNFLMGRKNLPASAGNRTRAARVAGEHSTTEPPMLADVAVSNFNLYFITKKGLHVVKVTNQTTAPFTQ